MVHETVLSYVLSNVGLKFSSSVVLWSGNDRSSKTVEMKTHIRTLGLMSMSDFVGAMTYLPWL